MGQYGGYYKGDKKKLKKSVLEKKAVRQVSAGAYSVPQVEITGSRKKSNAS